MFKNLKLALKIGGGFAIMLFLTAAVGFIGWNGMAGAHKSLKITEGVYKIEIHMLDIRQQEKNFIIHGDSEYIERVTAIITNAKEQIAATKAMFNDPVNQKQMDDILSAINNYEKAFNLYVDLHEKEEVTDGEMVAAARAVQAFVEMIQVGQKAKLEQDIARSTLMILAGAITAVVFGLLMAMLITLSITGAMKKMVEFAHSIAAGNLTADIDL